MEKSCPRHSYYAPEFMLSECHSGWTCLECYRELSIHAVCEMCGVKMCGVFCEAHLAFGQVPGTYTNHNTGTHTNNRLMVVCQDCYLHMRERNHAHIVPTKN